MSLLGLRILLNFSIKIWTDWSQVIEDKDLPEDFCQADTQKQNPKD